MRMSVCLFIYYFKLMGPQNLIFIGKMCIIASWNIHETCTGRCFLLKIMFHLSFPRLLI